MKSFNRAIIKYSVFLTLLLLFGQTILSQENKCNQIPLDTVLTKLRYNPFKPKSVEELNRELINEIREQKVSFNLDAKNEKTLRKSGANNLLIETIRQNPPPKEFKEAVLIYQKYIDNYESNNVEKLKIAIEAAKEFIAKFENDDCYLEQIKYLKDAIPALEARIYKDDFHDPINPKEKLKWELLGKIEKAYKIKNWNEVFTLGEKVLEIDPEFTPLIIVLAGIGFDQAKLNGDKSEFNDETVRYAELAVKMLETEKEPKNRYGAFVYEYKTKAEALDKMKEILDFMKNQNLYKTTPESIK